MTPDAEQIQNWNSDDLVERLRRPSGCLVSHRVGMADSITTDGKGLLAEAATHIEAQADTIERLRAALAPFADMADLMDEETTGFAREDEFWATYFDPDTDEPSYRARVFTVGEFYSARTALGEAGE